MALDPCAGRYPSFCSTEFPSVVEYDYETNLTTRGIDDRTFRWEDISIEASWLFLEASRSGSFEYNSYKTGVASNSGQLAITQPTSSSSAYSGWTMTGGYVMYIGTSGALLHTGNLTGYQGSPFWANPIAGDEAVGLWCNSNNIPKLISSNILNNESGIQTGKNHQLYLIAIANQVTGQQARLKAYIRATTGDVVVGYYDPTTGAWTATYPTGSFYISSSTYTEIKYSFNPSSIPFTNPEAYNIVIESYATGAFITVDDIHVDQYMKKNPYVDYIIPDGYMVQVTPNLGWHNELAQFNSDGTSNNPFLKTFGPFSADAGNLTDNLDNTISVVIDSGDFRSVTSTTYKNYLWRAIGISPNGTLGKGGNPERFQFIGREIESDFDVTNVNQDPTSTIKTISGKRNPRLTVLVDGVANHPGLEYPTQTSWKISIHVDGASQTVAIQGKDSGGATTTLRYVELTNTAYDLASKALWNVFDEHGLMLDLKRIPNESNKKYLERLKDVSRNRGGSSFAGVANSSTRELGLIKISDAISLTIPQNQFDQNIHQQVYATFESASVSVRTSSMIHTERVFVDPVYKTADLSKTIQNLPVRVLTSEGVEVPLIHVSIDTDEDRPSIQRILVDYAAALGKYITVSYPYYETLRYRDHSGLGSLVESLNNLEDGAGQRLVIAKLSMKLSGNEACLGLFITNDTISIDNSLQVPWTPIILRRVSDKEFREYFISDDGTYHDTKFQEYVSELRRNSRTLWGSVEADRDFWDAASVDQSFDYIPTLFDPTLAKFTSNTGDNINQNIDPMIAWGRSYVGYRQEVMQNLGIDYRFFHPGVAHTDDLKIDVYSKQLIGDVASDGNNTISEFTNNNQVVIFSGQR